MREGRSFEIWRGQTVRFEASREKPWDAAREDAAGAESEGPPPMPAPIARKRLKEKTQAAGTGYPEGPGATGTEDRP